MSEGGGPGAGAGAAGGGGAGGLQQGSPAAGGLAGCGPARAAAAAAAAESPGGGGEPGSARGAGKKAQLRSAPRVKKLEKLGVYSACKAEESCKCNGWKNPNPPPTPPRADLQQTVVSLADPCRSCSHALGAEP